PNLSYGFFHAGGWDAIVNYSWDDTPATVDRFGWNGKFGSLSLPYAYYNIANGSIHLRLTLRPRQTTLDAWQLQTWLAIRDSAIPSHDKQVQDTQNRIKEIDGALTQFGSLTLRRREREEIMRCTLRWLLGPDFDLQRAAIDKILQNLPEQDVTSACPDRAFDQQTWSTILKWGEVIKFLHEAVEWENVLFYPYSYFWDATTNWPFKEFLFHPDDDHETFLRAGAARVVLTIRPGFEHDFAAFVDSGDFKQVLPGNHPYVSIGDSLRHSAQ